MALPLLLVLALGIIEVSYALYSQHVVVQLSREAANLISRDVTLQDAAAAMTSMASLPVDFNSDRSRLTLSVIRQGTAGRNAGKPILYQRCEIGGLVASSVLRTRGPGAFGGPPDFVALDPDNDEDLQIINLPDNVAVPNSGLIFLAEVSNEHNVITPFDKIGFRLPTTLYSSAYF
ncbi:MAG: pilus assembly protein [Acidobacteria bacterium]|nr:pilus assembly protein [Acidobacteriota bacterium]